jgi:serine carboxypeptidase S28
LRSGHLPVFDSMLSELALSQLPIDHNNPQMGTFQGRYWVNTEFYQAGGPVFVHDVGETDAEPSAKKYLTRSSSYLRDLLEEFHGIGIVWEHRYVLECCSCPYMCWLAMN